MHRDLLPATGRALDAACGRGRHALWLAAEGLTTLAVDRDPDAIAGLRAEAARRGLPVTAEVRDLETGAPGLGAARFDVIVVVHYLHRPLVPVLVDALAPGGVLVYETFTRAQAGRGRPTNPHFLLESGELSRLVGPLDILRQREGEVDGQMLASVVARRAQTLAKTQRALQDDIKPMAQQAYDAQPEIEHAKRRLTGFTKDLRDEYRKGRAGE